MVLGLILDLFAFSVSLFIIFIATSTHSETLLQDSNRSRDAYSEQGRPPLVCAVSVHLSTNYESPASIILNFHRLHIVSRPELLNIRFAYTLPHLKVSAGALHVEEVFNTICNCRFD